MKKKHWILSLLVATLLWAGCEKSEKALTRLEDVKTATIGAMTGTVGETILGERFPNAKVKSFDDVMDAVTALKSGQIDAVITAFPTAHQIAKKNKDLRYIPEHVQDEASSIALQKGNDALLAELNRIIGDLKTDGTLSDMRHRWFKEDLSPYEELPLSLPPSGKVLRVGVCATREPLSFVDGNNRITGHDSELARIIGVRLHRPVEFANMKFMALIPALQSGKIDLILSGMTATEERKKSVDFSIPYFDNPQVMLVRSVCAIPDSPKERADLTSAEDLKDKRIGILLGSVHDSYTAKAYPDATILQYKSPSDILLAVKSGKVDAGLYTHETLLEIFRGDSDLAFLEKAPLFTFPIGMGFNKENSSLRDAFNTFLKEIKRNGVFTDMVGRWILKGEKEMPAISGDRSKGRLVVGTVSDKGLPFTILQGGKLTGFDAEIAERFAAYLGRELVWADMEFGSLIAAAATKKIDMIDSTLMITEEREKQIAFSDPYYELGVSAFALKKNIASEANPAAIKTTAFLKSVKAGFYNNILLEHRYLLIWDGLKTTIVISILAGILGTLLGAGVCFMRISKQGFLSAPAKIYIAILRGTPVLVLLMLIFYVVFASVNISPVFVAVIAFGLNFAAYGAEIFRTGIEGVDRGQTEAGISLGFTKTSTFFHIVLPQMVRRILPVYKGEFISLVKMTSIVGYIAVQDLTKAGDIIRSRTFDAFFPLIMVAVLYFTIAWGLMQFLEYLERITDPKTKRRKAGRA